MVVPPRPDLVVVAAVDLVPPCMPNMGMKVVPPRPHGPWTPRVIPRRKFLLEATHAIMAANPIVLQTQMLLGTSLTSMEPPRLGCGVVPQPKNRKRSCHEMGRPMGEQEKEMAAAMAKIAKVDTVAAAGQKLEEAVAEAENIPLQPFEKLVAVGASEELVAGGAFEKPVAVEAFEEPAAGGAFEKPVAMAVEFQEDAAFEEPMAFEAFEEPGDAVEEEEIEIEVEAEPEELHARHWRRNKMKKQPEPLWADWADY